MKAKDLAHGKWTSILAALGVSCEVLDGKHHPCPKDGAGQDRFRFVDRNGSGNYFCACSKGTSGGLGLLMCCRGWAYAEAAREVERIAGGLPRSEPNEKPDPRPRLNKIRAITQPAGDAVRAYLAGRGLEMPPTLKQARQAYWNGSSKVETFDTMIGLVVGPDGHSRTYHLTYLQDGKKAPVDPARKVMPPVGTCSGAAIRLYPMQPHIGIAEGIETAIAAHMLFGLSVWSVMNANGIESFEAPAGVDRVTVFADNDSSNVGQRAAYICAARLVKKGIHCDVRIPAQVDTDWNDEMRQKLAA